MKFENIGTLLIISLFGGFVAGVSLRYDMADTGILSIDKILKVAFIYLGIIIFLLNCRKGTIAKEIKFFIIPSIIIILILGIHTILDVALISSGNFNLKEIIRVSGFISILFLVSIFSWRFGINLKFFVRSLAVLGFITGICCIVYSQHVHIQQSWRMVGNYVRAGDQSVDPNSLAAFMNFATFITLAGFFLVENGMEKILFCLSLTIAQVGRLFTFSNGGHLNFAISMFTLLIILRRRNHKIFIRLMFMCLIIGIIFTSVVITFNKYDVLFHRLNFSDQNVANASVYSRLEQYKFFFQYYYKNPQDLLIGTGNYEFSQKTPNGLEIHNSQMRSFSGTGVLGFSAYLFLIMLSFYCLNRVLRSENNDLSLMAIFLIASFTGWLFHSATIPGDTSIMQWSYIIISAQLFFGYKRWMFGTRNVDSEPVNGNQKRLFNDSIRINYRKGNQYNNIVN
jgi:O-Antigen ligase